MAETFGASGTEQNSGFVLAHLRHLRHEGVFDPEGDFVRSELLLGAKVCVVAPGCCHRRRRRLQHRGVTCPRAGLGFGDQSFGLGFEVWGLGFGVWGLGFGIWDLGFGV